MVPYVYDYETFPNLFTACFIAADIENPKQEDFITFAVHETLVDERHRLFKFLNNPSLITIGYNSKHFDKRITQYLIANRRKLSKLSPKDFCLNIKEFATNIIEGSNVAYKYSYIAVRDLDLMSLWHFNPYSARATSLKKLQFNLKTNKIMLMPFEHNYLVKEEEVADVISYNINDVSSTLEFYQYEDTQNMLKVRSELKTIYGENLGNTPDASMGEFIILKELSIKTGIPVSELEKLRTFVPTIALNNIIFPYIQFEDNKLKDLLKRLKSKVLSGTKGEIEERIMFGGILHTIGTGGIHSIDSTKKGKKIEAIPNVYRSDENHDLILIDVSSYYPNLSIKNSIYPKHFGPIFCEVYENIYNIRKKHKYEAINLQEQLDAKKDELTEEEIHTYKKAIKDNKLLDFAYKLALNAVFGKSNSKYSPMYDPQMLLSITINGQLLLLMLAEQLTKIPTLKLVQLNTDGILIYINKRYIEQAKKVAEDWMNLTSLSLDFDYFNYIAQSNINNYIGQYAKNGYIKTKGRFELKKEMHKDHSSMIIPKAIAEYFSSGTPVEQFIKSHTDINDFMIRVEVKKGWKMEYDFVNKDGIVRTQTLPSMNRIYVTNSKGKLYRVNEHNKRIATLKKYNVRPMNILTSQKIEDYDIDYDYYIKEARKEIEALETSPQLTLF